MNKLIKELDFNALLGRAIQDYADKRWTRSLAMLLIAHCGARSNEVLRLTDRGIDVQNENPRIYIEASKHGNSRWFPLPAYLLAGLESLKKQLKDKQGPLFSIVGISEGSVPSAYELCRLYFNKIQLELFGEQRYTLHAFRHTLAMRALASGEYNLLEVQVMLGHRKIQSTMQYLEEYKRSIVLTKTHTLTTIKLPA